MDDRTRASAGLGRRFGARLIDSLVLGSLVGGLGAIIGFGSGWLMIGAGATLAYFALFDAVAGTTPGKRLLGLRVVGPTGEPPALPQAIAREVFTVVGAIPYVGPVLALGAWVWILVSIRSSPSDQGVHDRWGGGTRVLRSS